MAYEPTEKDIKVAEQWLRSQDPEIQKGIDEMGYYPFEYQEALRLFNKYAAWNIREFCKDLRNNIERWEESEEYENGILISDIFENEIINRFK